MLGFEVPVYGLDDLAWLVLCSTMVLMMQAGFCLLESGMVRTKNTINVSFKNLADFVVSALLFGLIGFSLMFGQSAGGLIGNGAFGLALTTSEPWIDPVSSPWVIAFFMFNLMFCGTATTIISGAVAERVRLSSYMMIAVVVAGFIYPVFGHWAWAGDGTNGGWLKNLGFIDFAGGTVVHGVGGWVALAAVFIVGPRLGVHGRQGVEIHGHNMTLAAMGALLLWFGWFGFNGGSTLGFDAQLPLIIANTTMAGASGGVMLLIIPALRGRHPDLKDLIVGMIAGLVAITPNCHMVSPLAACLIGSVGGSLGYAAGLLLNRYDIDDAMMAFPAHAVAGSWGALCVALLGNPEQFSNGYTRLEQLGVQSLGVVSCALWAFVIGGSLLWLVNLWKPLRVSAAEERYGLNLSEHGVATDVVTLLNELEGQLIPAGPGRFDPHTELGKVAIKYTQVLRRAHSANSSMETADREVFEENRRGGSITSVTDNYSNDHQIFTNRLQQAVEQANSTRDFTFGVVYVGVGSVDQIANEMGNAVLDELMRMTAERQSEVLLALEQDGNSYDDYLCGRLNRGVLMVLLQNVAPVAMLGQFVEKLHVRLSEPFFVSGRELAATVNIGVVLGQGEHTDPDEVLREAELAHHKAVTSTHKNWVTFDEAMHVEAVRRLRLEVDLRSAIDNQELQIQYRPIMDARRKVLHGVEAVVRWNHPEDGLLIANDFVPIAEETGLIAELGNWVLATSLRQLSRWTEATNGPLCLSVNISEHQLVGTVFFQLVQRTLRHEQIDPELLTLEIDEAAIYNDNEQMYENIKRFKELGVNVAVDNFGSGRTSLGGLVRLPINTLKLGSSFSVDIANHGPQRWIGKTIIGLAHQLGLTVVATNVESHAQRLQLLQFDCVMQQGPLYSRALQVEEIERWLPQRRNPDQ